MRNKIREEKSSKTERKNRMGLNNKGMGTVEIILIIVVLIGLVLIFKNQIMELVSNVFEKIAVDSSAILA